MLAAILSFTEEGKKQSMRIGAYLNESGYEVQWEHFGRMGTKAATEMMERGAESPSDVAKIFRTEKNITKEQDENERRIAEEQGESCRKTAEEQNKSYKKKAEEQDKPERISAKEFVSCMFPHAGLLIFVGACGIAVRLIAPHVRDKKTDPAVLVVDELGHFVIPLLSGHLGGANRYARWLADEIGATAVITTATDIEGRFAPDLFAEKYHLKIRSMEDARAVAVAGLGRDVKILVDVTCVGKLPPEKGAFCAYRREHADSVAPHVPENLGPFGAYCRDHSHGCVEIELHTETEPAPCVLITNVEKPEIYGQPQCVLTPKNLILGIGCRKGTDSKKILSFLKEILMEHNLSADAIRSFASIDLKRDEPGILAAAKALEVPFVTYSADELNALQGEFSASEFVKRQTGTDNVCERSAALAAKDVAQGKAVKIGNGLGRFCIRKQAKDGVTLAVYEVPVQF